MVQGFGIKFKPDMNIYLVISAFGDVFSSIGVREPQPSASEAFSKFGEAHRSMERYCIKMLKTVKPVSSTIALQMNKMTG